MYYNYFKVPSLQVSEHVAIGTFQLNPNLKDENGDIAGVATYDSINQKTGWTASTHFVGIDYLFPKGIYFSGIYFNHDGTGQELEGEFPLKLHCDEYCSKPPSSVEAIFYKLHGNKPEYFQVIGSGCAAVFAPLAQSDIVEAFSTCMRNGGCEDWLYADD